MILLLRVAHSRNWLLEHAQTGIGMPGYGQQAPAIRALAEAWSWLHARSLVAQDPGQSSSDSIFVTRRGTEVLEKGLEWLRATEQLPSDLLPQLDVEARPHFTRGDLDMAVFAAMRLVEVRLREAAGLSTSLLGVKLVQEAFKQGGPLHDDQMEPAESVAVMNLFAGAIGLFKNPSSHREVDYTDPSEAAEAIVLADLLLRILRKRSTQR